MKGTAVIKVAANIGEGPQLADEEWPYLLRTVVQAAKGKAAVVGSIHYKDTVRSIADAKRAQDLGAIGLQVTPPMFNYPTQDDLLRYYGALSDAIEIGIIVYNTWDRYVPGIQADTIAKMKDFEHVVAVKWGVPPDQENTYDEMSKFVGFLNVIDMDGKVAHCMRMGGRGYINLTADVYPPHDLKIWQLLENKKYDEAQALFDRVDMPLKEFFGKAAARSGGAARMKKGYDGPHGHADGILAPANTAARRRRARRAAPDSGRLWLAGCQPHDGSRVKRRTREERRCDAGILLGWPHMSRYGTPASRFRLVVNRMANRLNRSSSEIIGEANKRRNCT